MPNFTGTSGADELIGSEGDDTIDGRYGYDRIYGRGGSDIIRGILGAEEVYGGSGDDTIIVDRTPTGAFGTAIFIRLIDGGEGVDTLDLSAFSAEPFVPYVGGGYFETPSSDPATIRYGAFGSTALVYQGQSTLIRGFERIIGPDVGQRYALSSVTTLTFLQGGAGADSISVGGTPTIRGGAGNDSIGVGAGQRAYGEGDNDTFGVLNSYAVPTFVDGGDGQDILSFNVTDPTFTFTLGDGVRNGLEYHSIEGLYLVRYTQGVLTINVTGTAGADYVYAQGFSGTVNLGAGNDFGHTDSAVVVNGGDGDDILNGYGSGTLYGEAGNDVLTGFGAMYGGDGDDLVLARGTLVNGVTIDGGAGFDTFALAETVANGTQLIVSLQTGRVSVAYSGSAPSEGSIAGFERIVGGSAADTITLGSGHEQAVGRAGADVVRGGAGNDVLYGDNTTEDVNDGADQLFGDQGDDFLFGAGGNDTLTGGAGDDVLDGGSGADILDGGEGVDVAVFNIARSVATISYADGAIRIEGLTGATDTLRGIESIRFTDGVYDVVNGVVAAQARGPIAGAAGNDRLTGTAAADILSGGAGNDVLRGGAGSDFIDGGAGVDTARYGGTIRSYSTVSTGLVMGGEEGGTDQLTGVEVLQFLDGRLSFDTSDVSTVVYRLYDAAFDRAPDVFGLADYSRALSEGRATVQTILEIFFTSDEFRARYGGLNNEQFVREMYRFSLNREGDAAGVAGYVGALIDGSTTRLQLLMIFSESQEHRNLIDAQIRQNGLFIQDEQTASIARLYDSVFNRLPDLGGLKGYRDALDNNYTLKDVAAVLIGSPEFQARFGSLTNQQFVEQIYRFVLDREGDAAGIAGYVQALNNGYSRTDVVMVLSDSQEHRISYQATYDSEIRRLGVDGYDPSGSGVGRSVAEGLDKHHDAFVLPAEPAFEATHHDDAVAVLKTATNDRGQLLDAVHVGSSMLLDPVIGADDLTVGHHRSDWM